MSLDLLHGRQLTHPTAKCWCCSGRTSRKRRGDRAADEHHIPQHHTAGSHADQRSRRLGGVFPVS